MFGFRPVPTIDPTAAHRGLQDGTLVLVDVREPSEVAEVAVPGARHIPLAALAARSGELPADRRVGFICRSGMRSRRATKTARAAGLDAVDVRGGVLAWRQAGLPVR
jgi:rhodanese-related sulfurtransferase